MSEITKAEFDQLRAEIHEIRDIADATLHAIDGTKRQQWIDLARDNRELRRRLTEPPLWEVKGMGVKERAAIEDRGGCLNLLEIANAGRDQIAGISGVGPTTIQRLDAAMNKHGLSWQETV